MMSRNGHQPEGGNTPPLPTTGSGVKPADLGAVERDRLAKLVEQMIGQSPKSIYDTPNVRMALAIAASVVRRGRHLTSREELLNLANGMEEPIEGDTPEDIAAAKGLADRIRAAAGIGP